MFRFQAAPHSPSLPRFATAKAALDTYSGDDHINLLYPHRVEAAARAFATGLPGRTLYAVKANPHPEVLRAAWAGGVRAFDVASLREIDLVQSLFPAAALYLMHPVKSRRTIRDGYVRGVRDFSLDCEDELAKILEETNGARDLRLHVRLALPRGNDMPGGVMPLAGKFGADAEAASELLQAARPHAASFGVCFHVGSQCLDVDAYDRALAHARAVVDRSGVAIDSIDIGGGFPVAYPGMEPRPWDDYFAAIRVSLRAHGFDGLDVLGEPGRAICAAGGSTLARVELRKGTDLYLNDGTYGTLFDAGHFAWKYPVRLLRDGPPEPAANTVGFRFFGPTCDSADTMPGPFHLPADTREGDWIEIGQLGAYGQTLATQFNGFHSNHTVIITED